MIAEQVRSLRSALPAWLQSDSDSANAGCAVMPRQKLASTIRARMAPSCFTAFNRQRCVRAWLCPSWALRCRFDAAYHRRSPTLHPSILPLGHSDPHHPLTSLVQDATEEPRMALMEINLCALPRRTWYMARRGVLKLDQSLALDL